MILRPDHGVKRDSMSLLSRGSASDQQRDPASSQPRRRPQTKEFFSGFELEGERHARAKGGDLPILDLHVELYHLGDPEVAK
jgi:hypothetical protein